MWTLLIVVILAVVCIFSIESLRLNFISMPALRFFKKSLPPLSSTEQEAIDAGDVWWEGELFKGNPDWNKLLALPKSSLTDEEQSFIDHQVSHLLKMIDDYEMTQNLKDLPEEVWNYLKSEGFFALIIPKEYGGKSFSAYANSTIVSMIASRSMSAAVTVMVPNSLGPGELLNHYGTAEQKERWLPSLASGQDIPCFALTAPEAGSDAGSIPDLGIVCEDEFEGKKTLGIRLTWDKRYITLAPVATVLGLAFKLKDPDNLLQKDTTDLGITCALVPTNHSGVEIGRRHNPLNVAFMNGTTSGKDVFIPLDWIIGGVDCAGRGWRMLMECLSSGRGISLPALATAKGHLATRSSTAYVSVRKQFGVSIGNFEGVQASLARIISNTYQLEAVRRLTTKGIDLGLRPAIVSAISKYHMTEMGREVINDAMDIHAGKAIQLGRKNYLAQAYMGLPIAVTVEGANILTRSLMIFGQGAFRCHPFVLQEIDVAAEQDEQQAIVKFDRLLMRHIGYALKNIGRSFLSALTFSYFNTSPKQGPVARYYQHLTRFSAALAWLTDVSMLILGGQLKRKEMFSARLGDILSHLYLASSVLKMYEDQGSRSSDLPILQHVLETRLYYMAQAVDGALQNFPQRWIGWLCRVIIFPLGNHFKLPSDALSKDIVAAVKEPNETRQQLTHLCPVFENESLGLNEVESAFMLMNELNDVDKKLNQAKKSGQVSKSLPIFEQISQAIEQKILTSTEGEQMMLALKKCRLAIDVDDFEAL